MTKKVFRRALCLVFALILCLGPITGLADPTPEQKAANRVNALKMFLKEPIRARSENDIAANVRVLALYDNSKQRFIRASIYMGNGEVCQWEMDYTAGNATLGMLVFAEDAPLCVLVIIKEGTLQQTCTYPRDYDSYQEFRDMAAYYITQAVGSKVY